MPATLAPITYVRGDGHSRSLTFYPTRVQAFPTIDLSGYTAELKCVDANNSLGLGLGAEVFKLTTTAGTVVITGGTGAKGHLVWRFGTAFGQALPVGSFRISLRLIPPGGADFDETPLVGTFNIVDAPTSTP